MLMDCPACEGKLKQMISGSEISVCQNCGRVNPDSSYDDKGSEYKRDGLDSPAIDTSLNFVEDWANEVAIRDSSDENLVRLLLTVGEAASELMFAEEELLRAAELATAAWEEHLTHGRSMGAVAGACIYTTSRENARPRPISIVAQVTGDSEESINKAYRALIAALDVEVPVTGPETYVYYIGTQLNLPSTLIQDVENVLSMEISVTGNPAAIAGGALYLAANAHGREITLTNTGQVAGVAKETIWRKVRSLRDLEACQGRLTSV